LLFRRLDTISRIVLHRLTRPLYDRMPSASWCRDGWTGAV
jgi:hypothetical protein